MVHRSLRSAALMFVGALVVVQTLVTVLESQARSRSSYEAAFASEMQQAQASNGSRFAPALPQRK